MLIDVKDTKFVRDTTSMALINKDMRARDEYMEKSRLLQQQKNEINTIKQEVNNIRSDMNEIKNLLAQILDKGSNG